MDSKISIRNATASDIDLIINLAWKIWPLTYEEILSKKQISYMMSLFYSADALEKQMLAQRHFFLVMHSDEMPCGFASYSNINNSTAFKLHKIYVLPELQGKGLGRLLLNHVVSNLLDQGGQKLLLNVNRYNKARQFYERLGFTVIGEEDIDIGNGYFMNDFVMELKC
jgi:GNAT superfamily N-acetyltransferase